MASREQRLARVAGQQHGVFTLAQAVEAGYRYDAAPRQREAGAWHELQHRVYRLSAGGPLTWRARLMALVLATGGAARGRSAAALFGLHEPGPLEVVVAHSARSARTRRPEVKATRDLPPGDLVVVDNIPSMSPARTLIDLAAHLPAGRLEDLLDDALVRGLVRRERLARRAQALSTPGRRGPALVLSLLDVRHPDVERARNRVEALVLRLCRRYGLPDPVPNYRLRVGGRWRKIDAAWPEKKVALEFDGFVPHSRRRVFDDDRRRQNDLVDAGWKPFRLTKTALDRDPEAAFAPVVRAVLG